jgi:hypothetical protein
VHGAQLSDDDVIRVLGTARATVVPRAELGADSSRAKACRRWPNCSRPASGLALGTDGQHQTDVLDGGAAAGVPAPDRARKTKRQRFPRMLATAFFHAATVTGARSLGAHGRRARGRAARRIFSP